MTAFLAPVLLGFVAWPALVETRFEQVHPFSPQTLERSPNQKRAVLLVHGLSLHSLGKSGASQARFHLWQMPDSTLVRALGKDGDVFAFAYGQNGSLEAIGQTRALLERVHQLRRLGYSEIILIGHSAGGLLARMLVEDHPNAGVTRVLQVCSPNLGSSWARADIVRKEQEPFLFSLTPVHRKDVAACRATLVVPRHVQLVCLVGVTGTLGDGLVSTLSQWPEDLQLQGIPAVRLTTTHFTVMHARTTVDKIAELACQDQPRWSTQDWLARRQHILASPAPGLSKQAIASFWQSLASSLDACNKLYEKNGFPPAPSGKKLFSGK